MCMWIVRIIMHIYVLKRFIRRCKMVYLGQNAWDNWKWLRDFRVATGLEKHVIELSGQNSALIMGRKMCVVRWWLLGNRGLIKWEVLRNMWRDFVKFNIGATINSRGLPQVLRNYLCRAPKLQLNFYRYAPAYFIFESLWVLRKKLDILR